MQKETKNENLRHYLSSLLVAVTGSLRTNDALKKNITLGTLGLFILSSSILPTFAALNVGDSPYVSIDMDADDWQEPSTDAIERLIAGSENPFATEDGVLSNLSVSSTEDTLTDVSLIQEHIIAEGETIASIAEHYQVSEDTILVDNGLEANTTLKQGGTLIMTNLNGLIYELDKNISVEDVAKEYQVSLEELAALNDITEKANLKKGEHIVIPGNEVIAREKKKMTEEKARLIAQQEAARKALEAKKMQQVAAAKRNPKVPATSATPFKSPSATTSTGGVYQGKSLVWPTVGTKQLSQGFKSGHPGIDVIKTGSSRTTAIVASANGTIVAAKGGWNGGYGNMIILDHGNGMRMLYAHLRDIYVTTGQKVNAGEKIGWMGNTGRVYGPTGLHLHYEVHVNKKKVNPLNYL